MRKESPAGLISWLIIVTLRAPSSAGAVVRSFSGRLLMQVASDHLVKGSKITDSNNIITGFVHNY